MILYSKTCNGSYFDCASSSIAFDKRHVMSDTEIATSLNAFLTTLFPYRN